MDYQQEVLKKAALELIHARCILLIHQISLSLFPPTFIICLIPQLRHDYSEAVDFKLLKNFLAAQPFSAKLYVEGQCRKSFGGPSFPLSLPSVPAVTPPPSPFPCHSSGATWFCKLCSALSILGEASHLVLGETCVGANVQPLCPHGCRPFSEPHLFLMPCPHVPSHPTGQTTHLCPFSCLHR